MDSGRLALDGQMPLLQWLPDETFFSLCSRQHRLSGHTFSWQTGMTLFGHRQAGNQHDLPSRLDAYVARVDGVHGDAESIARHRTLLQFYAPFHTNDTIRAAIEAMGSASVAHLKYRLGLLTSRFRANHPLKACERCVEEDVSTQGASYWHLCHQFPGVWVCPVHGIPLLEASEKAASIGRFQWGLPTSSNLRSVWAVDGGGGLAAHIRFANLVLELTRRTATDGWMRVDAIQAAMRGRLLEREMVTGKGNLRLATAGKEYLLHCQALRTVPELLALPSDDEAAQLELGRAMRAVRGGLHPLRLFAMVSWLFDGADDFLAALACSQRLESLEPDRRDAAEADMRRANLLQRIHAGQSITSSAAAVGVDVGTAIAWAAKAGIATKPRPKVLKPALRAGVVRDLRTGGDKEQVAKAAGISVSSINRLLQHESGLHEAWIQARFQKAQVAARTAWSQAIGGAGVSMKLARALEPSAYAWLYRNDRNWLTENAAGRAPRSPANGAPSIRWDERDIALSRRVEQAGLELARTHRDGRPVRLGQLYLLVPELQPKMARLARLPLTRRALEACLRRRLQADAGGGSTDI